MKSLQPLRRASIPMQRQWNNMSIPNKIINKITKSDVDRDGVPNKWDCRPKNYFKQDDRCERCGKKSYGKRFCSEGCFDKAYQHNQRWEELREQESMEGH
jgi:ribosomal protein L37E